MTINGIRTIRAGDRLPALRLTEWASSQPRAFPVLSRDALILLLMPASDGGWAEYLSRLAPHVDDIEYWYSRLLLVLPQRASEGRPRLDEALLRRAYSDADEAARDRLGIAPSTGALLVVDRYGQLYEVLEAPTPQDLPAPAEIEEWAKFLATQCPECGVIDEPGHGEWSLG